METVISKTNNSLKATTQCRLEGTMFHVKLSTFKNNSGKLITTATAFKQDGNWEKHRVFQDFSHTFAVESVRVTKNAVIRQHEAVKESMADILQAVRDYYTSADYIARYGEDKEAA